MQLKPWEFGRLTPKQYYQMWDGYEERRIIQEDLLAHLTAWICSSSGRGSTKPSDILGRPTRAGLKALKAAKEKKSAAPDPSDEAAVRLAQKDAERKRKFEEWKQKQAGKKAPTR